MPLGLLFLATFFFSLDTYLFLFFYLLKQPRTSGDGVTASQKKL